LRSQEKGTLINEQKRFRIEEMEPWSGMERGNGRLNREERDNSQKVRKQIEVVGRSAQEELQLFYKEDVYQMIATIGEGKGKKTAEVCGVGPNGERRKFKQGKRPMGGD